MKETVCKLRSPHPCIRQPLQPPLLGLLVNCACRAQQSPPRCSRAPLLARLRGWPHQHSPLSLSSISNDFSSIGPFLSANKWHFFYLLPCPCFPFKRYVTQWQTRCFRPSFKPSPSMLSRPTPSCSPPGLRWLPLSPHCT